MVVRIVIAGESQCEIFAEVCLVADYLSQNLPNFCYERIEKPIIEWKAWVFKMNEKNMWHHTGSPLVWKEMLMKGSKPYYIGGASEFLEYCNSYYQFESFLASERAEGLAHNFAQYQRKMKQEKAELHKTESIARQVEKPEQTAFVVCISGAGNPLTMHLISGLLEMAVGDKSISKIYIHDRECSDGFMEFIERECNYIGTNFYGKVVKFVDKIGSALTHSDVLIVLNHVPFRMDDAIGDWLQGNRKLMAELAVLINASAARKICILFPNIGPACYNATVLSSLVNININNIVVATSDLGLEILTTAAEIAEIPLRNIFCPPVWGFVGINHLVDIRTTVHKYNSFEPYTRYTKVKNSSLVIGSITPELRTLEYLMYFDDTLWKKVADNKSKLSKRQEGLTKALAVLNVVKLWLFDRNPDQIVSLGVRCNGTFGLNFKGTFSQPCRFIDGEWVPAGDFLLPKDPQIKLKYLHEMAELCLKLEEKALPDIIPFHPCSCKRKFYKKKGVW